MRILLVAALLAIPSFANAAENKVKLFEAEAECFYATKDLPTEKQADAFKECMKNGAPLYKARVECSVASKASPLEKQQESYIACLREKGFNEEATRHEIFIKGVEDYALDQEMNDFPDFD